MTLTEQWKKGELESGKEYWVRLTDEWKNSIEQVYFNGEDFERFDIDDIEEVLAPVPSYEEWKTVFNCANKYEVEYIECANDYENVKKENQQLRKWCEEFNALEVAKENQQLKLIIKRTKASGNYPGRVSAYKARIINLSEENQQLKELLKECREASLDYGNHSGNYELYDRIDEVLK